MTLLATTRRVLARTLVHLYPSEWQARYGAGLLETIGARRVTWRDVADLAWCGVDEWSHAGPERPGRSHPLQTLRRAAVAIGSGYVVAIATTALCWSVFVIAVAIIRAWYGLNPFWILRLIETGFVMSLSVWFQYGLLFALPAVAICMLTGVGRRWTLAARLLTMGTFASFTVWLPEALPGGIFPVPLKCVIAVMTGWVIAVVLFPARRSPHAEIRRLERLDTGLPDGRSADSASSSGHPPHPLRAFTS